MAISGGACPGFYVNREPFLNVIRMHRAEVNNIGQPKKKPVILSEAPSERSESKGEVEVTSSPSSTSSSRPAAKPGTAPSPTAKATAIRNSQVTVLAPTGTIGFMMDCDTTGIEPDLALVKYKKLVGGGMIKIVNYTVPSALFKLGYNKAQVNAIVSYIDATGTIEGAPGIKPEHLAVFDCSFKPAKGTRSIHYMGHIKMMAATQPFLSGAISKTVNLPQDCTRRRHRRGLHRRPGVWASKPSPSTATTPRAPSPSTSRPRPTPIARAHAPSPPASSPYRNRTF